jgi:hypothetical protein
MRTLVVVRPTMTTLLRRPTLHMIMMIEGPPLLALHAKGGVCSQLIHVGVVCISVFTYLSILGLCTCMNLFVWCDEWWRT